MDTPKDPPVTTPGEELTSAQPMEWRSPPASQAINIPQDVDIQSDEGSSLVKAIPRTRYFVTDEAPKARPNQTAAELTVKTNAKKIQKNSSNENAVKKSKVSKDPKSTTWMMSLRVEEHMDSIDLLHKGRDVKYFVGQMEEGTDTPEERILQFFVEFYLPVNYSSIVTRWNLSQGDSLEIFKGTRLQAFEFCTKPELRIQGIFEKNPHHRPKDKSGNIVKLLPSMHPHPFLEEEDDAMEQMDPMLDGQQEDNQDPQYLMDEESHHLQGSGESWQDPLHYSQEEPPTLTGTEEYRMDNSEGEQDEFFFNSSVQKRKRPKVSKRQQQLDALQRDLHNRSLSVRDIYQRNFEMAMAFSGKLERYRTQIQNGEKREKTKVYAFIGRPGTGKSHTAHEMFPNAYWKTDSEDYWEGYNGEENVVLDEFTGWLPFTTFARICDKYPYLMKVKHSSAYCGFKTIVVTSNRYPHEMYDESIKEAESSSAKKRKIKQGWAPFEEWAFLRRFDEFWYFTKIGEEPKKFTGGPREISQYGDFVAFGEQHKKDNPHLYDKQNWIPKSKETEKIDENKSQIPVPLKDCSIVPPYNAIPKKGEKSSDSTSVGNLNEALTKGDKPKKSSSKKPKKGPVYKEDVPDPRSRVDEERVQDSQGAVSKEANQRIKDLAKKNLMKDAVTVDNSMKVTESTV